ncbi:MAG: hypothetical protein JW878_10780 [Methanomicrobia archaeon]|nr:hypothetical protein [Methanomicrobia archaeon]
MEKIEEKTRDVLENLSPETQAELKEIAESLNGEELFTAFGMPEIDELLWLAANTEE